jgi:hypothetical protein
MREELWLFLTAESAVIGRAHTWGGGRMRIAVLILIAALLCPGLTYAKVQLPHRGQCRKLTKQMEQYAERASMASRRGDSLWRQSSQAHITRLEARRDRLCPDIRDSRVQKAWNEAKQIVLAVAKTAITYFTMGAY